MNDVVELLAFFVELARSDVTLDGMVVDVVHLSSVVLPRPSTTPLMLLQYHRCCAAVLDGCVCVCVCACNKSP